MNTDILAATLPTLLHELVEGAPDPATRTYVLNRGDAGLIASLDRLSAAAASEMHGGAPSIAAHVDHLRFGLAMLRRWMSGAQIPREEMDWTASWARNAVSEAEWRTLRDELRREAGAWEEVLRSPGEVNETQAGYMIGSVVHLAYHLGAIRQIDRALRGPTAEDEVRAEAALGML